MTSKLKQIQDRQAAIVKAMRELSDKAVDEDGRQLTEEEQAEFDKYEAELAETKTTLAREQKLQEFERSLIPISAKQESIAKGEEAAKKNEWHWEEETRNAAAIKVDDENQRRADGQRWTGEAALGQLLQAVARAEKQHPSQYDRRLTPVAITGLGESIGSEGGFLVGQDIGTELVMRGYNNSQIINGGPGYGGVTRIPLSPGKNGVKLPAINESSRADGSRWGGVQMYWAEEGGTKTASQPDFRQIDLKCKKLIGLIYATDELLEDALALEAFIMKVFGEEFAFKLQDAFINGTGAGQPQGVGVSPALVSVAKETGQVAKTIVKENIDKMYSRMDARVRGNSVWHINQDCEPQLFGMSLAVGTGGTPVYLPPGGIADRPLGTLMGRPVVPIEQCQTVGTKLDLLYCSWGDYFYCDKGPMKTASSIHVRFINDEQTFRFVFRCDGQTAANSPLTPYKGTNTLSSFIALAARA